MEQKPNTEIIGTKADLEFLYQDHWLKETVVQYQIEERKGRFWVRIIYVDSHDPLRFLIRTLNHYSSLSKADHAAQFLQRSIGRDVRGTLKINIDAFYLCFN